MIYSRALGAPPPPHLHISSIDSWMWKDIREAVLGHVPWALSDRTFHLRYSCLLLFCFFFLRDALFCLVTSHPSSRGWLLISVVWKSVAVHIWFSILFGSCTVTLSNILQLCSAAQNQTSLKTTMVVHRIPNQTKIFQCC